MKTRHVACLFAFALASIGCRTRPPAREAVRDACNAKRLTHGGSILHASDGVPVWFKRAGTTGSTAVVFVHGGPGYNALTFEHSSGRLLEAHHPVLYVDQRGCGRSGGAPADQLGMANTIADLDAIRAQAGFTQVMLIGHSFGGVVAAEYAHRYPARVAGLIMVDTTPDLHRALAHQVAHIDAIADAHFPAKAAAIHAIARAQGTPFAQLGKLYEAIGRLPLQRVLHYADPRAQDAMEAVDQASGLLGCTDGAVVDSFERDRYLSERKPSLAARLPAPTLLIAGRASQVIGADNIRDAAALWGARLIWIDAGHFVYFEQPEAFVAEAEAFLREIAVARDLDGALRPSDHARFTAQTN